MSGRCPRYQLLHSFAIRHVRHAADQLQVLRSLTKFLLQKELAVLVAVDQHQLPGFELQQLAADLRPDAAGGPGDEQHLAVDPLVQSAHIQFHRIPTQQVGDRDGAGAQVDSAVQQLFEAGQHLDFRTRRLAAPHDLADLDAGQLIGGEQDLADPVLTGQASQLTDFAQHGDAANPRGPTSARCRHETDDLIRQTAIVADRTEQRFTRVVGADNDRAHSSITGVKRQLKLVYQPTQRSQAAADNHRPQAVEQEHTAGDLLLRQQKIGAHHQQQRAADRSLGERDQVIERQIPTPPLVNPKPGEDAQFDQQYPRQRQLQLTQIVGLDLPLKAQPIAPVLHQGKQRQRRSRPGDQSTVAPAPGKVRGPLRHAPTPRIGPDSGGTPASPRRVPRPCRLVRRQGWSFLSSHAIAQLHLFRPSDRRNRRNRSRSHSPLRSNLVHLEETSDSE